MTVSRSAPAGYLAVTGALVYGAFYLDHFWPLTGIGRAAAILLGAVLCILGGQGIGVRMSVILFLAPAILYVFSALLVGPMFELVKMDIRNMIFALAYVAALGFHRKSPAFWEKFQLQVHRVTMLTALTAAVLGWGKLILHSRGYVIPQLLTDAGAYPSGTSLHSEYNVFALGLAIGLSSSYVLFRSEMNYVFRNMAVLSMPTVAGALFITGSRRAVIYLCMALFFALVGLIRRRGTSDVTTTYQPRIHALVSLATVMLLFGAIALQWQRINVVAEEIAASEEYARIADRLGTLGNEESLASRVPVWDIAWAQLLQADFERLLIGGGFYYVSEFGDLFGVAEQYPHNFVLSSLLYGGVIQTTLILVMIGAAFRGFLRCGESGRGWAFNLFLQVLFLSGSSNSFFSSELALIYVLWGLQVRPCPAPAARSVQAVVRAALPPFAAVPPRQRSC